MRRRYVVGAFACLVVVTAVSAAGDFWRERDYRKWSAGECETILSRSPWAHPHTLTGLLIPAPGHPSGGIAGARGTRIGGGFEAGDREVHLVLQMRFLAAAPMRAAIGRMRILQNPGDREVEKEVEAYVDREDPPEIAVELTWFSRPAGHSSLRDVEAFFRDVNLEQLKTRCYLSSRETGTTVAPTGYVGPAQGYPGALLSFPRFDENGDPHFQGSERTLLFRLEARFGAIEQTFSPRRMFWNDAFTL